MSSGGEWEVSSPAKSYIGKASSPTSGVVKLTSNELTPKEKAIAFIARDEEERQKKSESQRDESERQQPAPVPLSLLSRVSGS